MEDSAINYLEAKHLGHEPEHFGTPKLCHIDVHVLEHVADAVVLDTHSEIEDQK